jgi:hypothetical protein
MITISNINYSERLATLRIHARQATADKDTSRGRLALQRMARVALRRAREIAPDRLRPVPMRRLEYAYDRDYLWCGLLERQSWKARRLFLLRQSLVRPRAVLEYVRSCRAGRAFDRGDMVGWIRQELRRLNITSLIPVGETQSDRPTSAAGGGRAVSAFGLSKSRDPQI